MPKATPPQNPNSNQRRQDQLAVGCFGLAELAELTEAVLGAWAIS
jgi:hypothetical protein